MTPKRDSGERKRDESERDGDSARLRENAERLRRRYVVGGQVHQPRDALDLFLRSSFFDAQMELERSTRSVTIIFFSFRQVLLLTQDVRSNVAKYAQ